MEKLIIQFNFRKTGMTFGTLSGMTGKKKTEVTNGCNNMTNMIKKSYGFSQSKNKQHLHVSVILPAYNEAENIEKAVKAVESEAKYFDTYEIIIAEDGSTDGTDKIAASLADGDKIIHLHSPNRLGRGRALKKAILHSRGGIIAYIDVDLSTDMKYFKPLINYASKYGIAIGSRLLKQSKTKRPVSREIPSRVYNFLVRHLLDSSISDHQCGFKAFRRDILIDLIKEVRDNHWFMDTEILIIAQRKGYTIKEIPVEWTQGESTRVNVLKDSIYMFKQIMRMRSYNTNNLKTSKRGKYGKS